MNFKTNLLLVKKGKERRGFVYKLWIGKIARLDRSIEKDQCGCWHLVLKQKHRLLARLVKKRCYAFTRDATLSPNMQISNSCSHRLFFNYPREFGYCNNSEFEFPS